MTSNQPDLDTAAIARRAYESLEPYHVLAYFNPGVGAALDDLGIDGHAFYVGGRAAPLGETSGGVVAATFYNFSPALIDSAWARATEIGLDAIDERRYAMLDEQYRTILGDAIDQVAPLLADYEAIVSALPLSGRPLAAAWAATPSPEAPHLALWRYLTILREWRGDNHIAQLVTHQLPGADAAVFHEAELPDPTVQRRVMGRRMIQLTRGLTDDDWEGSVGRLVARGLVTVDGDKQRLTDEGFALYQQIEAHTDAVTGASFDPSFNDLIDRTRPLVKLVLDAGVLPGTKRKG
ncbi:SCO6745 family protein [Gordonia sp. (in: high G+C Gram-positive bacteria)]|uniref:SCO6745 family protein n=1 Tax=Gordonia sp. (in: high G+C Gram-positive bacteria) TaxID=84139 RepID=UPI003C7082CE